ncbi:S-layer homology domain-containing protein, partial [Pseudoflavonifractor capillosus]|uniref:S-layer homology domain-containing protein n=1 Tax=Pseudoflavonifractor capillosus TaxID=106588 RepID=UPI00195A4EB0
QAVEIMVGDENGDFNPDQNVTRNEMAVIMANLMEYNVASYKNTSPFTDVPSWAEPYVAACWTNGITAGYSSTIYGGSDTVTTAQAALMLMKALGYFQYASDFGSDWQLATTRQGNAIDLFNGVDSGVTQAMTRNDVAQLVLNTLKSGTVEASTDGSWTIGDVTINNNVTYSYITSNQTYATAIDDVRSTSNTTDANRSIVELGEQLYMGDLRLNDNDTDDFGRPARNWTYDSQDIGTYAKRELMVESYTEGVTGREIYNLLGTSTIRDNDLYAYEDGEEYTLSKDLLVRSNEKNVGATGRGVLTEIYLDDDRDEITIASINTYLAQANSNYSESSETISLQVYNTADGIAKRVDVEDVPEIADLKEGDFVLVNWAGSTANKDVVAVFDVEILTDVEITRFSKSSDDDENNQSSTDRVTKLTTGGTEYQNNVNAWYEEATLGDYFGELLTDKTYNVYLDQYGNFIGAELYSGDDQYVFIAAYDMNSSAMGVVNADALAIFTDGTMEQIEVDAKDTNENIQDYIDDGNTGYAKWENSNQYNRWFTYTEDDGVYTLEPVARWTLNRNTTSDDVTIRTDNLSLTANEAGTGRSYGNDDSIYITVEDETTASIGGQVIDEVTGIYTGVQDARLSYAPNDWVVAVYDSDHYIIAAIVLGEAEGAVDNYAYILTGAYAEEKDSDGNYYWDIDVILNGEIQTMTIKSKYSRTVDYLEPGTVQELVLDADNYVTKINDVDTDKIYDNTDLGDSVEGFDVYNIEVSARNTAGAPLYLIGRTLHYTPDSNDVGLAVARDAKAVVSQVVNGDRDEVEYGSVEEAFSTLADANPNSSDLQYAGRVIAVLDADGVAQWVFFYDYTSVNSGNTPDYGNSGNVKNLVFVDSSNNLYATEANTDNKVPNATIVLEQLQANGYVTVGTFTTDADGKVTLPVASGATYRATCGNVSVIFTNN